MADKLHLAYLKKVSSWHQYVYIVAFILFSLYILYGCLGTSFLRETADMTPFYTDTAFAYDMLGRVGGLVFYVASLMQSCFHHPWLGSLLFIGVLVALAYAVRWAFRIGPERFGWCLLPSLFLLLHDSQLGYFIYLLKMPAVAFTPAVGVLMAVCIAGLMGRMESMGIVGKVMAVLLLSTVGYWLMGIYAVLALALFVVMVLFDSRLSLSWRISLSLLSSLVVIVPQVLYGMGYILTLRSAIYTIGIPDFRPSTEWRWLLPCVLAFAALFVLVFVSRRSGGKRSWMLSLALFLVVCVYTWSCTNRDANLRAIVEMKQAIEDNDYQQVLDIATANPQEPTRLQVMFTRLALLRTGHLADGAFQYPDGEARYDSPRDEQFFQFIGGRMIYYHFGMPNNAYRWGMEGMVEYGLRPEYVRWMYRCALLNGEKRLAEKYAALLRHTWFYLPVTPSDAEMEAVRGLMGYENSLDYDQGVVEGFILSTFSPLKEGGKEIQEMSLVCNMIRKDGDAFWPHFAQWWESIGEEGQSQALPLHLQEAVLLFGQMYQVDIEGLPIDPYTIQRYQDFFAQVKQNANDEYSRTALKPQFGNTYWYYYFYMNDLTTY